MSINTLQRALDVHRGGDITSRAANYNSSIPGKLYEFFKAICTLGISVAYNRLYNMPNKRESVTSLARGLEGEWVTEDTKQLAFDFEGESYSLYQVELPGKPPCLCVMPWGVPATITVQGHEVLRSDRALLVIENATIQALKNPNPNVEIDQNPNPNVAIDLDSIRV